MIKEIFSKINYRLVDRKSDNTVCLNLNYINNTDGTIRWMWPMSLQEPLFLKFYNITNRRSKFIARLIKLSFKLRVNTLIYKRLKIHVESVNPNFLVEGRWALFTGTPGPNRKAILYDERNGVNTFTKISLTENSARLIANEAKNIRLLSSMYHLPFDFSSIISRTDYRLQLEDVSIGGKRNGSFGKLHESMLTDLALRTGEEQTISETLFWQIASKRLETLKESSSLKIPRGILKKVEMLMNSIDQTRVIKTSMSHGDFTSWNMYERNNRLVIYDWELGQSEMPFGFDGFHFIIQQGVLVDKKSWNEIKREIETKMKGFFEQTISNNQANTDLYLKLYLLVNTLYYLTIYNEQNNWHMQITWLLNIWNEAVSDMLQTKESNRKMLLLDIFDWLKSTDYSVLKYAGGNPEDLSPYSDIDMVIKQSDYEKIKNYLAFHPLVKNMKIGNKSYMAFIQIITNDGDILNLDLIWKLKRKNLNMMSTDSFINESMLLENGVKIPQPTDLARYVGLFYGLNGAQIPQRYIGLEDALDSEIVLDKHLINLFRGAKNYNDIKRLVLKMSSNKLISRISRLATYMKDTIRSFRFNKGLIVTFSGVDGAGKSTIIENVHFDIEKRLRRKVVIIRHRPSILPILSAWTKGKDEAERQAASKLPRQGTNYAFLPSLLRFAYYYTDYFFGQFYVWAKYTLRGTVVLYDRYYFDFINDARRSNINLPAWMVRIGYVFLMKPALNIFLYADSKIILSRKRELDAKTIEILTDKYMKLFTRLNSHKKQLRYIAIENIDLQSTLNRIHYNIFEKIA